MKNVNLVGVVGRRDYITEVVDHEASCPAWCTGDRCLTCMHAASAVSRGGGGGGGGAGACGLRMR